MLETAKAIYKAISADNYERETENDYIYICYKLEKYSEQNEEATREAIAELFNN